MKPKQIHVGSRYISQIGRKQVIVVVNDIREVWDTTEDQTVILYDITIEETGEQLTLRTATKFRRPVGLPRFDFELGKTVYSKMRRSDES